MTHLVVNTLQIFAGGWNNQEQDAIWEWNARTLEWVEKARMKVARMEHAVSTVQMDHYFMDFCG